MLKPWYRSFKCIVRVQNKLARFNFHRQKGSTFRIVNSALAFVMKERAGQGIGVDADKANFMSEEQENYLRKHGFQGSENA